MVRYLEFVKAICKQSEMWELNNPRVIGMIHNIIQCVQNKEELDRDVKEHLVNVVLSNLIIFSEYDLVDQMTKKIILLGDSIIDNKSYVSSNELDVTEHLEKLFYDESNIAVENHAVDGDTMHQLEKIT